MRWKRILIGLIFLVAGLYAAIYAFLHFYDLNRFKPRITRAVFDATGRRLALAGDLEVDFGLLPVLAAEDISLQNAPWGSQQEMIRIKRLQIRVALLPLIWGRWEIASILLTAPDIFLERNEAGELNFPAGSGDNQSVPSETPLIHRIEVENARLAFEDRHTGQHLELTLQQASAELPDIESPLEIDLEGTFNTTPVAVFGTIGRPLPAFLQGGQLPANLSVEIAGNRFQLTGLVGNTDDFSGLDWKVTGAGKSIPDLGRLAGIDDLPDLGPFKIEVVFSGSPQRLAMRDLILHIGDRRLAKVFLRGRIGDLLRLQDVDMKVTATADELKKAGELFGTTLPWQGEFRASGRLVRSAGEALRLDEAELRVGDSDITAQAAIDLQHEKPRLSATVRTRRFDLRPLFAADAFQRPFDGGRHAERSKPSGTRKAETPREPLLNRFDADLKLATGTLLLPQTVMHPLKTSVRLEKGRIRIQTEGPRPPDLEGLTGISALPELGPIRLTCDLTATDGGLALRNVDLKAGSLQRVRVTVSGSIAELLEPTGFDLDIRVSGSDAASLATYLPQPWPLRGRYAVSARMVDSADTVITFDRIAGSLEDIEFTGSVKVDAAGEEARVAVAVNAPRFNLRPFVWRGLEIPEKLKGGQGAGPLDASLVLVVPAAGNIGIAGLRLAVGTADRLAVSLQGNVSDVETLTGIDLQLEAGGREIAALEPLFGESIPLQGPYAIRTTITDPAAGRYRFDPLLLSLAGNRAAGSAEFDRSGKTTFATVDLSAGEVDLTALMPATEKRGKPDAGRVEKALDQQRVLPQWPVPPQLIHDLGADIRVRADRLQIAELEIDGLSLKGGLQNDELELNAEARRVLFRSGSDEQSDDFQMGGVNLAVDGRAAGDRMTVDSFRLRGGTPEAISVSVEGSVADTVGQTGVNFQFDIHGQDVRRVWQLVDANFDATGPFSLSGSLSDPRPKLYRFADLKAAVGDSRIDGRLEIDYTGRRPRISARMSSPRLDLRPFFPEIPDAAASSPAAGSGRTGKLFSDDPWPLQMLAKIDLAVSLDAAHLFLDYLAPKDLHFELGVDDGNLVLKPLQFSIGGGKVSGEMTLLASDHVPTLKALIEVSGYDVGRELKELGREQDIQGTLNGRVDLNGPAESTADFMSGLSGQVVYTVTEGKINNRIIGLVYGDISDTLLNLVRPVSRKSPFVDLNCLVQSFDIKNGQAQNLGLLDTPQTTLITTGTINLAREKLDITLRSSSKGGVRIGGLGRIGFSLNRFTRPFKLAGTLASPTLAVDPSQTALTIGTILGGFALGPAGVAAILADVSVGDKNPCLAAMEALGKGEEAFADDLTQSKDLPDQTSDSPVEGGPKDIEESGKTFEKSPQRNQESNEEESIPHETERR